MLKDPFSLIPDEGADVATLRAACQALAQRLRDAEHQRDEAEMALRRIVYRHRKGLELIRGPEVAALNAIAVRNANPLRAADSSDDAIVSAETVLHDAVIQAVGLLNQVAHPTDAHRQAHLVLRRSLRRVDEHAQDTDRRDPGAPD
jgi:hypothetical protein